MTQLKADKKEKFWKDGDAPREQERRQYKTKLEKMRKCKTDVKREQQAANEIQNTDTNTDVRGFGLLRDDLDKIFVKITLK